MKQPTRLKRQGDVGWIGVVKGLVGEVGTCQLDSTRQERLRRQASGEASWYRRERAAEVRRGRCVHRPGPLPATANVGEGVQRARPRARNTLMELRSLPRSA